MCLRLLILLVLILSQAAFANGRKPAVEDFVGIEVDHPEATPQGTETLFNFEKDMDKFEQNKGQPLKSEKADPSFEAPKSDNFTTIFAVIFILGLPAMIWFLMMHHLRQKAHLESASNIEVLDKYRKEREAKKQDDFKKAS